MLTVPSNTRGTLNPEAHEFKYKSMPESTSKSDEESNQENSETDKNNKGKQRQYNYRYPLF